MKKLLILFTLLFLCFSLSAESGIASWYTADKVNALTANGYVFDNDAMTAAHKTLKFGTIVKITNLDNGLETEVKINDRGPYVDGRIIDVTPAVAKELEFYTAGKANVTLEIIEVPETEETKYITGQITGWYTLQIGSYTNIKNAYSIYENILSVGLKPFVEVVNDNMIRLSVTNIPAYLLNQTREKLSSIGITEPLEKGALNPYN